jgi:endonuclease/exonuclease/phosphatase family metal-dependent hydrolase
MRHLYRKTHLRPPPKPVHTFPSWSPDRALDHVLTAGFDGMIATTNWLLAQERASKAKPNSVPAKKG